MSFPESGEGADLVRLRSGVVIGPADNERWQVRWDFDEVLFLSGESCRVVLPWLVPRLNGQSSLEDLENDAQKRGIQAAFREVIDCLCTHRFLDETPAGEMVSRDGGLTEAVHALGGDADAVRARLGRLSVVVVGCSRLAVRMAESVSAQGFAGVELRPPGAELPIHSFLVAVDPDCGGVLLESINAQSIVNRRPWMLVGAWNRRLLVGPIFVPGETACYDCYRTRLASHRAHLEAFRALDVWRRTREEIGSSEPLLPALAELTAAHVALELFHFAADFQPARTVGRVLVYQPADAALTIESVLRVPWCRSCVGVEKPMGICGPPLATSVGEKSDE